MVIDTLFMCYCADVSENDGSPGKEYYAPDSLRSFMEESGEARDAGASRAAGDEVAMQSVHQRSPAKEEAV